MDLGQYRWQDHMIRSDWWLGELAVALCAAAALFSASIMTEPLQRDRQHTEAAGASVPAGTEAAIRRASECLAPLGFATVPCAPALRERL